MQSQSLVKDQPKSDEEETITPSFYRSGPSKLRSCTDILCLFLFVINLILAVATIGLAFWYGNPYLLFNGFDSQGRMCGKDNLKNYPLVYFLDPFVKDSAWKTVCVSRCPNVKDMSLNCKNVEKIEGVPECPPISRYSTEKSLNSYCDPDDEELAKNLEVALKTMNNGGSLAETFRSWKIIILSMMMAYLVSFFFIAGSIFLSRVIIVFSIIIIQLCLLFTASAMLFSYTNQKEFFQILKSDFASENNKSVDAIRTASANERLIISISFFIASLVFLIYTIFWRNHIKLLMDGATSNFIGSNKSFIGFSFLIFLIYSLYIMAWIIIALYLSTWSSKSPQDFPKETLPFDRYEINQWAKLLLTLHVVSFVWIILFILSTYNFLVSSSCMQWYFAQGPTENLRASNPLAISLQFYFKYHLGSVALGSILHLLFRPFNFICAPIYKKALMNIDDDTNCCVKYILKCCRCFFILYEEYFMYICREAFLEIALQGKHFFAASKDAYFLIHRNSKIYQATDILGSLAYWIGNLFITFVTTFCCVGFALKVEFFATDIEKPLDILGIILVLAFFVSSLSIIFLGYSMDALIFTYLIDQEIEKYYYKKNDGIDASNAPLELKEFIRIVDETYF